MRSKRSWFSSNDESSFRNGSKTWSSYPACKSWEPKEIVEKVVLSCSSWSIGWHLDWPGTPLAHLNKTRWSLLAQLATKQGNFSWCEYVISKKTLKRMKNKEDLASKVSKASARSAAFIHVTGSTHNSYRHQVSHFIHSTSIMSYLILSSTSITHTQRWNHFSVNVYISYRQNDSRFTIHTIKYNEPETQVISRARLLLGCRGKLGWLKLG